MYQAAVFDMDGTILDTLDDLQLSLNRTLQEFGREPYSLDEVRSMVGNGVPRLIQLAVGPACADEERERVLARFKAVYGEHCNDHTKPYAGIVEMVGRLRAAGVRVAVVSNKVDFAVRELAELHFPGVFDAVMGQRDDVPRKPDPTMVFRALDVLGVAPEKACYVGDSEVDVLTAANSGLDPLIVTWGFRSRESLIENGATVLVDTPTELEALVLA